MGQPDTNSTIGATASNGALVPTVWETYRDISTVMLATRSGPRHSVEPAVSISSTCGPHEVVGCGRLLRRCSLMGPRLNRRRL